MRKLETGENRFTEVVALDKFGPDGPCENYYIGRVDQPGSDTPIGEFAHVNFQNGSVAEVGVNGCFMEDLIAICIDRLKGFQSGELACQENDSALIGFHEALHWLNHRTRDRQKRGVEGSLEK